MTASVHYAPGQLPPFWDRSVVFFANLLALFYGNQAATDELESKISGVATYGGRLCPIVNLLFRGPENLLVLEARPHGALIDYFVEELGIGVPEIVVLDHAAYRTMADVLRATDDRSGLPAALKRVAEHSAPWVDGFVTDGVLSALAEVLGKRNVIAAEVSRRCNNKMLLHQHFEREGFPVFDTVPASSPGEVPTAAAALRAKGYRRIVVKSQVGASGIGMRRLEADAPELDRIDAHMFYEGPCLVQGWLGDEVEGIEPFGSPSVQMFLDEAVVWLYDVTEQILSAESVHEGNMAPPLWWRSQREVGRQLHHQAEAAALWLHDSGYRGTASADFLVVRRHGKLEVRLCEINARVTGATYPSVLARRFLPGGSWLMRNLTFNPPIAGDDLLAAVRRAKHLYREGADGGVLPVNFNTDAAGLVRKGQFLCLGPDANACFDYLMHSANDLPVTWTYDRD